MESEKKILSGLSPEMYEHVFDKKALDRLKVVPALKNVLEFITKHAIEKLYSIQYTGSHLRVSEKRYPEIYEYLKRACQILDVKTIPELYVKWDYTIDAETYGSENPIIVLNSGLLDLCTDDEIMFLIGHEVGHIKSNHMLYHMAAEILVFLIDYIPLLGQASQLALYYWDRMSDLTADRAGLLCCQNSEAMISALMKMAGVPLKEHSKINTESFLEQARSFEGLKEIDREYEMFMNEAEHEEKNEGMDEADLDKLLDQDDNTSKDKNNSAFSIGSIKKKIEEMKILEKIKSKSAEKEDKFLRMAAIAGSREPWTVMRASELLKWIDEGNYKKAVDEYGQDRIS